MVLPVLIGAHYERNVYLGAVNSATLWHNMADKNIHVHAGVLCIDYPNISNKF